MPGLFGIPGHITYEILKDLSDNDLKEFRTVCKWTAFSADPIFRARFFKSRSLKLNAQSVRILGAISEHPFLGPSVHAIRIKIPVIRIIEKRGSAPGGTASTKFIYLDPKEYGKQPEVPDETNSVEAINARLIEAIKGLRHCRKISIRNESCDVTYCSPRAPRDPDPIDQMIGNFEIQATRYILGEILGTVAQNKIPVETFHLRCFANVSYDRFVNLGIISGLKDLNLTQIRNVSLDIDQQHGAPFDSSGPSDWGVGLSNLLQTMPNLSNLRLSGRRCCKNIPRSWFSILCYELQAPQLASIKLECVSCTSSDLAYSLLRHQKTLRKIELWGVDLVDGTDSSVWYSLFERIYESMSSDIYLKTEYCSSGNTDIQDFDNRVNSL